MTSSGRAHLDRLRYDIIACRDVASDTKKTFGVGFWCVQAKGMTELILIVKMETKRDHLVMNFHWSIIIAELQDMKFWVFFRKMTPCRKISKFCFQSFHCDTNRCVQILWSLADWKSVKPCIIYVTKTRKQNFTWLSSSHYYTDNG